HLARGRPGRNRRVVAGRRRTPGMRRNHVLWSGAMGIELPIGRRAVTAFIHDVAMAALSFPLALWLRLGGRLMEQAGPFIIPGTALFAGVAAAIFLLLGLYRGVWRYASLSDLIAILRAVTLLILVYLPIMFVLSRLQGMPRSALVINWFVLVFLLG